MWEGSRLRDELASVANGLDVADPHSVIGVKLTEGESALDTNCDAQQMLSASAWQTVGLSFRRTSGDFNSAGRVDGKGKG
jgi:hypothetical protein